MLLLILSMILGIGYLHRDVKPANYTIGRAELKELRKVYVLDFGMARKFVHDDGTIKKPRAAAGFRGTVKYAPVACHAQREMCRLDDLETWLYQQVRFGCFINGIYIWEMKRCVWLLFNTFNILIFIIICFLIYLRLPWTNCMFVIG